MICKVSLVEAVYSSPQAEGTAERQMVLKSMSDVEIL